MKNSEIIKTHFYNLMEKYGLSVLRESYSPKVLGNAEVVFTSDVAGIQVVVDRNQVLISIGNISWSEDSWFELTDVMGHYAPDQDAYIFLDKEQNEQVSIEAQVIRTARILDEYCRPLLEGDFSHTDQIRDLEAKRVTEMKKRFEDISRKVKTDSA